MFFVWSHDDSALYLPSPAVEVSAGAISMTVQYAGFPIWTQQDDLCTKMTCPAASGPVSVVFQQEFPIITPPVRNGRESEGTRQGIN